LAKLALITYLARTLSRKQENIKDVKESFIPIMGSVCVVFILIALANLSTALMLFGVSILLLIIGRISIKQIAVVCAAGFILLGVLCLGPRRQHVCNAYKHVPASGTGKPDKSFQSDHAKIAIAAGGILVKARVTAPKETTCQNPIRMKYTPLLLKSMVGRRVCLVGIYLFLLYRCIKIVTKAPKAFGALLACGLSFSLTIQAFANMAVAVGLGPVTGVPLPFVSMGGTSDIVYQYSLWYYTIGKQGY
jgi:cell division protein FtsW